MTLGSFVLRFFIKIWMLGVATSMTIAFPALQYFHSGGGGAPPIMAYMGRLRPRKGYLSRLQVHVYVRISLVTVYGNVGKSVISVCKEA